MTRRELFRRYAAEHFTASDVPAADRARCRGTVERQTSRARLASLARITPRYPLPEAVDGGTAGGGRPRGSGPCGFRRSGRAETVRAGRTTERGGG
ncbi:hypothetical protein [Kitasatospora cineracea]|uniref:Uncharacterized protein n=1 Tax=Kitasatospora cineracea TaxID=88074 RepID=A0A8G1UES8_9ACTN|nr:hypothetical protein [Kitasatospora cineracea]ROR35538.1 hypothetical protein EDD39_7197 [Kitasatospora cineracea]